MATSIVPWNLVANAQSEGVSIPVGWAVDEMGNETTDPNSVRALYPFGQHKGSGQGIMIDILCAMLTDAPFGPDIPKMYGSLSEPRRLGGLVGAIHVDAFVSLATFRSRIAEMISRLRQLKTVAGVDRVRYPGEPELEAKRNRLALGIPVGMQVFADLNNLASEAGVTRLEPLTEA
jgi:ureidoglycolate dehydrogenase (NAD+)